MLCLATVLVAVLRTDPTQSGQEPHTLERHDVHHAPPGKNNEALEPPSEQGMKEAELPDLEDIEEIRSVAAFDGVPIDPVVDSRLAVSFCSRRCASIPNASFWDVPASIMFERGATCPTPTECYLDPPTDMAVTQRQNFTKKLGLNSRTKIAVVGSSGSLRHTGYAAEIDAHDVVVRVNGAPIGKYQTWVGQKNTVAFSAPGGAKHVGRYPDEARPKAIIYQSYTICGTVAQRKGQADHIRSRVGSTAAGFYTVDPDWACSLWRDELHSANAYFPSTGMNAAGFFANLAKRLGAPPPSVYGFGGQSNCEKYYDCYSKGINYGSNNWHPFKTEHQALRAWNESGHIVLHM